MGKKREQDEEKILDVDARMQGTIAFKDPVNLRINGSFEGKLETRGNLTIGENAVVRANIDGDKIIVAGKVTGDIKASESLSVVSPAVIEGNISTPTLSVSEGAIIQGKLTMLGTGQGAEAHDVSLTLRDVAQYLEVESKVVEEWAQKKKIPAKKEEGNWIFSKTEIDRWIQEDSAKV